MPGSRPGNGESDRRSARGNGASPRRPRSDAPTTPILDGRFDEVPLLLTRACGPAPDEACQLLEAVSLWWQIQLDPFSRTRDAAFETQVDAAIAAIEAWTTREPQRAEAWFYLGGAYGARSQWRVLRGERLAAARDGKRIKDSLERALSLDPEMADAHFGIGLYRYYADVAPAAVRILQWLFLLPGGDRAGGLDEIDRARKSGLLLRSEADYQLHLLYLWYEKRPESALALLEDLVERHPRNPHFPQAVAELHDVYRRDADASLRSWQAALQRRDGRGAWPRRRWPRQRHASASPCNSTVSRAVRRRSSRFARSSARDLPRRSAPSRVHTCNSATRSSISDDAAMRLRRTKQRSWPLVPTILCASHRARARRCARDREVLHTPIRH